MTRAANGLRMRRQPASTPASWQRLLRLLGSGLLMNLMATIAWGNPPEDIEALVHTVMIDGRLDFPLPELTERAERLQADLTRWRSARPQELQGVLAEAKITWLLDRLHPHVVSQDSLPQGSPGHRQAMQQLQEAASQHPRVAAVHFWRAQLFASPVIRMLGGHLTARPLDRQQAIAAARQAWELDDTQAVYRDALATFLADDFRDDDALQLLVDHDGGDTPLAILLRDLAAIPLPAEAFLLQEDSRRFAEDQLARGRISDALSVRARVYLLRCDSQEFERLCRQRWPQFRLLTARQTAPGPAWRSHAMQVLLLGGDDPRPIADLDQLDVAAMDGISLTLIELRDPPQAQRRQSPAGVALPVDLGEAYVYLYILNDRTIH